MSKFIDLTGQQFNSWKILRYAGNRYWTCLCLDCKKITKNVHVSSLKQGTSKSCGCLKRQLTKDTLLERYGETVSTKIYNPREVIKNESQ